MCDSLLRMRTILSVITCLLAAAANAQTFTPADLASGKHQAFRCDVSLTRVGGRAAVELKPQTNNGQQLLMLQGAEFRTGTIEFEVFATKSSRFIGLAWHVESEKQQEVIYFRPFRFRDTDPVGRRHAIQYVSHPDYTWNRLRSEFPDVYESACPVDPEQWIKVRVEVRPKTTRVFVDGLDEPVIVVDRPFVRDGAGVALWTGVSTKGYFGNVKIVPDASDSSARPTPKPAAKTARGNQAFAIAPAAGKAVNLLATIDPNRHALVGDWSQSEAGLEVQPKPFAQIVIPQGLPKNYDLDLAFTRRGSNAESVTLFLPIGPKGVAVQFAARGEHDGIGLINGTPSWQGPATRKTKLKTGERMEASVRVRQQGDRVRIAQYVNGEPHVSWEGPANALSLYQAFKIPSGKAGLGAFNNNAVFHSVTLKPVN